MPTFEEMIETTTTLKTLERVEGTQGGMDYFIVHEGDTGTFSIKADFARNMLNHPFGIFLRLRITTPKGVDIQDMHKHFISDKFDNNQKRIVKELSGDSIAGSEFKTGGSRISVVVQSKKSLNEYGDPSDPEHYEEVCANFEKDFKSLGNRLGKAIKLFDAKGITKTNKLIAACVADYVDMFKPHDPEELEKAEVIPLLKKDKAKK